MEARRSVIHVVVALRSEARPLARHFDLKPLPGGIVGRPAFSGPDLRLIVSGMGKSRTALAVEGLSALHKASSAVAWLNVGIAGHRNLPVGEAVLADGVVEEASGRTWRLHPIPGVACRLGPVCTVETVEERYPTEAVYEMEAASLCAGVPDAIGAGLLQVLKVVSDNQQIGTTQITAEIVEELIERQLEVVEWLIRELRTKVGAGAIGMDAERTR